MSFGQKQGILAIVLPMVAVAVFGCTPNENPTSDGGTGGMTGTGGTGGMTGTGGTAGVGGSAGSSGAGGSGDCAAPAFEIDGVFNERYNCRLVQSQICAGEDVRTEVTINPSVNGVDYTFTNVVDETMGVGQLCGNVYTWVSMGEGGFEERGVWTFSDRNNVTITTTFTRAPSQGGDEGECVAVATTEPDPGPPPDLPCTSEF